MLPFGYSGEGRRGFVLAAPDAPPRRLTAAYCGNLLGGFGEAEEGHVGVDRLVVSPLDHMKLPVHKDQTLRYTAVLRCDILCERGYSEWCRWVANRLEGNGG